VLKKQRVKQWWFIFKEPNSENVYIDVACNFLVAPIYDFRSFQFVFFNTNQVKFHSKQPFFCEVQWHILCSYLSNNMGALKRQLSVERAIFSGFTLKTGGAH
jgi:hypothetical protein